MAKEQPHAYQQMSDAATERMRDYCAFAPVQQRLADFFGLALTTEVASAPTVAVADNASC
jgi:hypothetical protein